MDYNGYAILCMYTVKVGDEYHEFFHLGRLIYVSLQQCSCISTHHFVHTRDISQPVRVRDTNSSFQVTIAALSSSAMFRDFKDV